MIKKSRLLLSDPLPQPCMQRCRGRRHQQRQRSETAELLRRYAMTTKARVFCGRCLHFIRLPNEARGERKINGGVSTSVSRRNSIRRQRIRNPLPFGTNQKARTRGGGALAFTDDRIERSLRFDDRRAEKKDATRLVSSTTIEYRTDHTISAKSMYTRDNTYRQTSATLEGRVSTPDSFFSRYTPGCQNFLTIFIYPHLCALLWRPQPLSGDEQALPNRGFPIPSPD